MLKSARLKVNWFPVQIPQGNLIVNGVLSSERGDYKCFHNVRQYQYKEQWLAVCVAPGKIPQNFGQQEVSAFHVPRMTSTFISEAFLLHYEQQGFIIERGRGQNAVFRPRMVENLPPGITFYEGLIVKPFHIATDQNGTFGLVIDFTTRQEFTNSIANDSTQVKLAEQGHEVYARFDDGSHVSGFIRKIKDGEAVLEWHGKQSSVQLSDLRVKANYSAIGDYVELSQQGRARNVIRLLMVESLSLTKSGFANVDRLTDRYKRVAELLGRNLAANINIPLPTICQSVISVATEPANVELRQV